MPNLRLCFPQYKCINDLQKSNPQHALKDKGVIDIGCSRHITGNMSYMSDFEELNGRYVAFGGNPNGGKISGKDTECIVLSPEFKLPDENQVLLRVPRENNMYNVDLKNIIPSGDLTCLFAKATLDESNLWHRRLGDNVQQYVLFSVWSSGSKNPHNTNDDAAFRGKKPEFEGRKPASEVHVSSSSNFSDNSINEDNAVDSQVHAARQISTNNTNTFSDAGPSNTAVSPTHGKSSYVDTSQYPDDPNMPELEDITYTDDEEDVGAEADFTNLEITITVSLIQTTIVHKDHLMTQIIGDLSSATQTRSMTRVVKDQAYASFMGFMVYQMDVKSAFLYGTIEEEVYVCQPPGFEDSDYPDKVYKVVNALNGLHQAPRAWYETLANYLLENGFQKGKIDQTLFIKRKKCDILLVQIYVDDSIFGSTNKDLCKAFEKLMKDKFQMSSMGELIFFLDGKSASTPIDTKKPLLKDPDGEEVDVHTYRSMIGSLMYLTSSRPDIMFVVCACARFQVTPKASYLHAVKRIFRYLKGKPHLGLWYPKDSPFNLVAYLDSDYAGASLDRKSTTGGCQFLGCRLISWQ
nr:putative ribonuclease H-like domain-containing protein [Tanacetum cinerariifolium]